MHVSLAAVLPLLLSAIVSWGLLRQLMPLLRSWVVDHPNPRSSHSQPTPRGGGLVLVVVGGAGMVLMGSWLPWLCLPLALVGFLDDLWGLPASLRYVVQIGTGLLLLISSPLVQSSSVVLPLLLLLLLAVTALINFVNFMDGLDGLVAVCLAVALAAVAMTSPAVSPLWPLVGALMSFLLWNWCPAKVFMGDVGSTFLGSIYAAVVLHASSWQEALALVLLQTPLIADASLCVLRRLRAGQGIFQAHRLHLYQRLHQAGWSHARVAALYGGASGLLAVVFLADRWGWLCALALVEVLIGIVLDQCVAVPFSAESASMARHPSS